jgi:hypothetical protein
LDGYRAEEAEVHNPLRSEAEMFRVVVVVGLAAIPVVVLGLAIGPEWGAIALGVELGIGLGLIWRATRGSEPHRTEVATSEDSTHRVLVVANETVAGRALLDELVRRTEGGESDIRVVVPALPSSRLQHLAHDVDSAIDEARRRLQTSLAAMSSAGLRAEGTVGDHHDPNAAIEDALRDFAADEIVISTHPPERSKWLEQGVVERAERDLPITVTHVIVDLKAERAADVVAPTPSARDGDG